MNWTKLKLRPLIYLGSAQFASHAESEVFSQDSDTQWLRLFCEGHLGLIAIDEAHGKIAWMESIQKGNDSVYRKNPPNLSKEWWRSFMHHLPVFCCWRHISCYQTCYTWKTMQGSYTSLQPTEKDMANWNQSVLLPRYIDDTILKIPTSI